MLRWKDLKKTKRKQKNWYKNIQAFSKYKCFWIAWWRHFCYASRKRWEFTIFFIQSWKYIKSCFSCDFTPLSTKIRILMQKSPRNSKIELFFWNNWGKYKFLIPCMTSPSPNYGKLGETGTITASRHVLMLETQKYACILI